MQDLCLTLDLVLKTIANTASLLGKLGSLVAIQAR